MATVFKRFLVDDELLTQSETTQMTLEFGHTVTNFGYDDFYAQGVTLSNLSTTDGGYTWTATVTPNDNYEGKGQIFVIDGNYNIGNTNVTGNSYGISFKVDTVSDTTAPDASSTQMVLDIVTADNIITQAESKQQITVSGKVTGEFQQGDKVTLTVNNKEYTGTVDASGVFNVAVSGTDLVADSTISASVAASDKDGNVNTDGSIKVSQSYSVDTTATGNLVLVNFEDSANATDGLTNDNAFDLKVENLEAGSAVEYQEKLNGTWVKLDTPTLQNVANGTHEYRAVVTDLLGNVTETATQTVTVDTEVAAPNNVRMEGNTITGNAEANAVVSLVGANGSEIISVTADNQGLFNINIPAGTNTENLSVLATDTAGNVSEATTASLPNNYIEVYTAASSLNSETGLVSYESLKTTSGNDIITIGDEHRQAWTIGTNGNIWNKNPAAGYTVIDTGAGNDSINAGGQTGYGDMFAYTKVLMGSGNDTFAIKGKMLSNSQLDMGIGNDTITIGKAVKNTAAINAGQGNDTLNIGWDIDGHATVKMGQGNDTINVGDDIEDFVRVNTGSGNDAVNVKENVEQHATVLMGEGNDILTTGIDIDGRAKVDTGTGNDSISVGEDIEDYARISMGQGDDVLSVNRYVENSAIVDMGEGNNTAEMAGLNNSARIHFGSGNDSLTITDEFGVGGGSAVAVMGAGDDTVTYGGKTLDGKILGGLGTDTLVLDYDNDNALISQWSHITNLQSDNFKGFEVIDLQGNNAVDIYYSDLIHDNIRDGALFVKGNSSSKVDLGGTDWNSDTDKNLHDYYGKWESIGSKTVDGVTYDVYHHQYAYGHNDDVYIQQGIVVI